MLQYDPLDCLPSAEDLPDSDDTPVDNELQDLIPSLLKAVLGMAWADRMDWFFGIDMGIYYDPNQPAIVPDGFLSLGVERVFDENLRLSYVLWEEQRVPIMTLEVVSQKRRGEYSTKKELYAQLEVLYYVVYNPQRRKKQTLEVYHLVDGKYQLQRGNPIWFPEIGLGIGCERGTYQAITREWLYWYDEQGMRLLTPEERVQQAQREAQQAQREAQQARQRAQMLAEQLKSLGVDPDSLV
jgi:Uma2 family endonuclease